MADEETGAPKQLSIAEALKEGVKGATQSGNLSFDELDGASRAAVPWQETHGPVGPLVRRGPRGCSPP